MPVRLRTAGQRAARKAARAGEAGRREPVRRSDGHLGVQALMGPVGVLLQHPCVDRRLRLPQVAKGRAEEGRAERAVEPLHTRVLVRRGRSYRCGFDAHPGWVRHVPFARAPHKGRIASRLPRPRVRWPTSVCVFTREMRIASSRCK